MLCQTLATFRYTGTVIVVSTFSSMFFGNKVTLGLFFCHLAVFDLNLILIAYFSNLHNLKLAFFFFVRLKVS